MSHQTPLTGDSRMSRRSTTRASPNTQLQAPQCASERRSDGKKICGPTTRRRDQQSNAPIDTNTHELEPGKRKKRRLDKIQPSRYNTYPRHDYLPNVTDPGAVHSGSNYYKSPGIDNLTTPVLPEFENEEEEESRCPLAVAAETEEHDSSCIPSLRKLQQSHHQESVNPRDELSPDLALEDWTHGPNILSMAKSRESKVSHRKRLVDLLGSSGHSTTSRPTKYGLASADSFRDSDLPIKTDVPWPNPTLTTDDPKHSGTDKAYKSNAPVLSKLRSSKVTYARQRSFLGDPTSMASSEHRGIPVTLLQSRGAGQTCTTHLNDRPTSVSDDEEDGNPRPVRSIYELRQAGDNARFRESVEAIFEDIEDSSNSPSGTWSSLAQLCVKLSEPAFVRRFSEHGFNERLIRCMASNKDIVSASLALCAFRLIYLDASSSYTSLRSFWVKLLWLSPELLTNNDSILSLSASRATNLSQTVQRTLKKALGQISSVIIDRQVSPQLSPCLVTLSCIHFCLATFLIKGDRIGAIPAPLLNQIIELPLSQSEKSNGSVSPDGSQLMEAAFLVLETYTMLSGVLGYEQPYSFRLLFQHHDRFIGFDQNDRNHQISTLYTRVILNLTNNHPSLCEEMANPEMVFNFVKIATAEFPDVPEDSSKDENNSFNAVILALGILINLTEQSEMSRASFLKPAQNDMSLLQLLLQHFSAGLSYVKQMGSVSDVHYNVVIGYLSIVLVTLCLNQDAFSLIKVSMGGRGLTLILSTAEEFLQHHQMVEQDSHNCETQGEGGIRPTTRMKNILSQIRGNAHV